jgi:predicted nucleic acid-binding protein
MDQLLVAAAARLAASLGLRGADSFYVTLTDQLNLPLATLDQDQERTYGTLALTVTLTISSLE